MAATSDLRIVVERDQDCVRVHVSGALGAAAGGRVRDAIASALLWTPARVEVHLDEGRIVDVLGLAAVVASVRLGRRQGVRVEVVDPSSAVERVMSATGLGKVLPVRRTLRADTQVEPEPPVICQPRLSTTVGCR